jgi:hypothetical protein
MGRVINPESAGKQRTQHMRTIAEMLRHLTQKPEIDKEAKDMIATMIYCMREIEEGIEVSAAAWEKRDYYLKADEFRRKWDWASSINSQMTAVVYEERWQDLPPLVLKILPQVSDITITKFTRKETDWLGAYDRLLRERPAR